MARKPLSLDGGFFVEQITGGDVMASVERIKYCLDRGRASDFFPVVAENDGYIYLDAHSLGACFLCKPFSGIGEEEVSRLKAVLSGEFTAGTQIQFIYFSVAEISDYVNKYRDARSNAIIGGSIPPLLHELVKTRIGDFEAGLDSPPIKGSDGKVINCELLVTINVPLRNGLITDEEESDVISVIRKFEESLNVARLFPTRLNAAAYLYVIRKMLDPFGKSIDWQGYDDTRPMSEQILGASTSINIKKSGFDIDDMGVRVLSVKRLPSHANLGTMGYLIGDPSGVSNQFSLPFVMTSTIYYPDQINRLSSLQNKAQAIRYQAFGPMQKYIPILAHKLDGMNVLFDALDSGEKIVELTFNLSIFGKNQDELDKNVGMATTYYKSFDLHMCQEERITWPVFLNMLPLFSSEESRKMLFRHNTMAVRHAVNFLPVVGEWRGTGSGAASMFLTRRNQPVLFDFYDCNTAYNGVLFAESGAGKSVLTQHLLSDYLSFGDGVMAWVIDIGRSYYKLCKAVGGEFVEFTNDSKMCLNPFTHVVDLADEIDVLKGIVAKMAEPNEALDAHEMVLIEEAIISMFGTKGNKMTVTDVQDYLNRQDAPEAKRLGRQLFPFCRGGSFQRWFEGENNLNFNNRFVVLEMEELKAKPHLCKVVLMQLMAKIQHSMYLAGTGKGRRKLLFIDEAYNFLGDPSLALWLSECYRRIRKEEGSALVVTQSIADLYASAAGVTIANNSPFKFVMQQTADAVNTIERDKRIDLTTYGFQQMKSVHTLPGKYSEVMICSPMGVGIVRLTLDRFRSALFSTSGKARTQIISDIQNGIEPIQAINRYLEEVA